MKLNITEAIAKEYATAEAVDLCFTLKSFECKAGLVTTFACDEGAFFKPVWSEKRQNYRGRRILQSCYVVDVVFEEGLTETRAFTEMDEAVDFAMKMIAFLKA